MFLDFIKKLSTKLIRHEFFTLGVYGDGDRLSEKTNVMIMEKNSGGIFYIVGIVDGKTRDLESYDTYIKHFMTDVERQLGDLNCTRVICLNIVTNGENVQSFVDKTEFNVDDKVMTVWWLADLDKGSIYVPQGQPDQVLNLDKLLSEALAEEAGCDNSMEIDYKQYETAVRQATALQHRTPNSLLTMMLVLINALIFIFGIITGNEATLVNNFAINPTRILAEGEWYRLVTAMFLHLNFAHLLSNGLYLYLFGSRVEKYYGKRDFFVIYFLSGILGSVLSLIFTRSISAGASGAIYGLLGATLALSQVRQKSIDGLGFFTILIIFIPGLIMGFLMTNVDVFGHIGGAIGGYFVGYLIQKIHLKNEDK